MSSSSTIESAAPAAAAELEAQLAAGDLAGVDIAALQRLICAALRVYAAKADTEGYFPIVPPGAITATEAMIPSSALLKSVNIAVFELGLWESWGGVR